MTPLESGWDVDLISLANLLWQPGGAPAPLVQLGPSKFQGTLRLVTVNDSFLNLPVWYLTTGEVFRQIDFYYYFHLYHRRYPDVTDSAVARGRYRADSLRRDHFARGSRGALGRTFGR